MIKKLFRGAGLLALCLMVAVMPVKAADDPVSLIKSGSDVKVVLSKEAIDDEVHSLHLSIEVDVTKGSLSKDEVSFDWALPEDAYKTQFCEEKDGSVTLDIYTSAKENLFSAGDDGLTLGVVKLAPAKGSVTAKVAVTGSMETVNGVQEMNKVEGAVNPSVEVTAGKSSGGKKPGSSSSNDGSGSSDNSSSNNNTNNNQTAKNNNAGTNNTNANVNLGINNNNSIMQAVPNTNTVEDSAVSQNRKGQSSENRTNVQKESLPVNPSDTESEIMGTQLPESEEAETEHESLPESEVVSIEGAESGIESEGNQYVQEERVVETPGMAIGVKVFLGILIIAVVAIGVGVAVRLMNKKKDNK